MQLTYVEFELLRTMASQPGRVFSRKMLLQELSGPVRLPRAAHDRRPRAPPPGEARERPERALADPHGSRRRLPLPGEMNPLRSVGARLSLALVAVVALALCLVYLIVVPSLRNRLVDTKLSGRRAASPQIQSEMAVTPPFEWADKRQDWACGCDARVVVYSINTPPVGSRQASLLAVEDSDPVTSPDINADRIAQAAADTSLEASGIVRRGGVDFVEVAVPAPTTVTPNGGVLLFSASLQDAQTNVNTVKRRLLEAGLLALALALVVGYGAASVFARRIRRLERAAEEIAAGRFDEPIVDRQQDELGELARAFDRMRLRLSQLEWARREFVGNASHELRTRSSRCGASSSCSRTRSWTRRRVPSSSRRWASRSTGSSGSPRISST